MTSEELLCRDKEGSASYGMMTGGSEIFGEVALPIRHDLE